MLWRVIYIHTGLPTAIPYGPRSTALYAVAGSSSPPSWLSPLRQPRTLPQAGQPTLRVGEQLVRPALLSYAPPVEDDDLIEAADAVQPVREDHYGTRQRKQHVMHLLVALEVDRSGGLVA